MFVMYILYMYVVNVFASEKSIINNRVFSSVHTEKTESMVLPVDTFIRSKLSDFKLLGTAGMTTGIGALYYEDPLVYTYEKSRVNAYDISTPDSILLDNTTITGSAVRNISAKDDKLIVVSRDSKSGAYDSFYPYYANLFESNASDIPAFGEYAFSSDTLASKIIKSLSYTYKISDIKKINLRKASPNSDGTFTNGISLTCRITVDGSNSYQSITYMKDIYDTEAEALNALKSIYTGKDFKESVVNHDFYLEIDWDAMPSTDLSLSYTTSPMVETGGFDCCLRSGEYTSVSYGVGNSPALYEGCACLGVRDGVIQMKRRIDSNVRNEISLLLKVNNLDGQASIPVLYMGDETRSVILTESGDGVVLGLTNGTDTVTATAVLDKEEWYNLRIVLSSKTLFLFYRTKELPSLWSSACSMRVSYSGCDYYGIGLAAEGEANIEIDNFFYDKSTVDDVTYGKGTIFIIDKSSHIIEKKYRTDLKCSEISIKGNLMVLTCLGGANFYDISDLSNIRLVSTFRVPPHIGWVELQGSTLTEIDGKTYHITSTYLDGIIIHDVTDIDNIVYKGWHNTDDLIYESGVLKHMTFDICAKGTKAYQTLFTHRKHQFTDSDRRGIVVWDLSDIDNPSYSVCYIDDADRSPFSGGDAVPNRIDMNDDIIVCNNDAKGVIIYSLDDKGVPRYEGSFMPVDTPAVASVMLADGYLVLKGTAMYVCDYRKMKPLVDGVAPYSTGVLLKGIYHTKGKTEISKVWYEFAGNTYAGSDMFVSGLAPDSSYTAVFCTQDVNGRIETDTCVFKTDGTVTEHEDSLLRNYLSSRLSAAVAQADTFSLTLPDSLGNVLRLYADSVNTSYADYPDYLNAIDSIALKSAEMLYLASLLRVDSLAATLQPEDSVELSNAVNGLKVDNYPAGSVKEYEDCASNINEYIDTWISDMSLNPHIDSVQTFSTGVRLSAVYSGRNKNVDTTWWVFSDSIYSGPIAYISGLKPDSLYSAVFCTMYADSTVVSDTCVFRTDTLTFFLSEPYHSDSLGYVVGIHTNMASGDTKGVRVERLDADTEAVQILDLVQADDSVYVYTLSSLDSCGLYSAVGFYKYYDGDMQYGNTVFVSLSDSLNSLAYVKTMSACALGDNKYALNGIVVSSKDTISAGGFEYMLSEKPDDSCTEIKSAFAQCDSVGMDMEVRLSGLFAGMSYSYRAFAVVDADTLYGKLLTFATDTCQDESLSFSHYYTLLSDRVNEANSVYEKLTADEQEFVSRLSDSLFVLYPNRQSYVDAAGIFDAEMKQMLYSKLSLAAASVDSISAYMGESIDSMLTDYANSMVRNYDTYAGYTDAIDSINLKVSKQRYCYAADLAINYKNTLSEPDLQLFAASLDSLLLTDTLDYAASVYDESRLAITLLVDEWVNAEVKDITIELTSSFMPFCSRYALDFSESEDIRAFVAVGVQDGRLILRRVEQVPANCGVVLHGEEGEHVVSVFDGSADEVCDNLLVAAAESTVIVSASESCRNYPLIVNGNKCYVDLNSEEFSVEAGGCYVRVPVEQ